MSTHVSLEVAVGDCALASAPNEQRYMSPMHRTEIAAPKLLFIWLNDYPNGSSPKQCGSERRFNPVQPGRRGRQLGAGALFVRQGTGRKMIRFTATHNNKTQHEALPI